MTPTTRYTSMAPVSLPAHHPEKEEEEEEEGERETGSNYTMKMLIQYIIGEWYIQILYITLSSVCL